jgi:hypothetical protein
MTSTGAVLRRPLLSHTERPDGLDGSQSQPAAAQSSARKTELEHETVLCPYRQVVTTGKRF